MGLFRRRLESGDKTGEAGDALNLFHLHILYRERRAFVFSFSPRNPLLQEFKALVRFCPIFVGFGKVRRVSGAFEILLNKFLFWEKVYDWHLFSVGTEVKLSWKAKSFMVSRALVVLP